MLNHASKFVSSLYILGMLSIYFFITYPVQLQLPLLGESVETLSEHVRVASILNTGIDVISMDLLGGVVILAFHEVLNLTAFEVPSFVSVKVAFASATLLLVFSVISFCKKFQMDSHLMFFTVPGCLGSAFLLGDIGFVLGFSLFIFYIKSLLCSSHSTAGSYGRMLVLLLTCLSEPIFAALGLVVFLFRSLYLRVERRVFFVELIIYAPIYLLLASLVIKYIFFSQHFGLSSEFMNFGYGVAGFINSLYLEESLDLYRLAIPFIWFLLPFSMGYGFKFELPKVLFFILSLCVYFLVPYSIAGDSLVSNQWVALLFVSYPFLFVRRREQALRDWLLPTFVVVLVLFSYFAASVRGSEIANGVVVHTDKLESKEALSYYSQDRDFNGAFNEYAYIGAWSYLNGFDIHYTMRDRLGGVVASERVGVSLDPYHSDYRSFSDHLGTKYLLAVSCSPLVAPSGYKVLFQEGCVHMLENDFIEVSEKAQ